jgi:hypothetical protein
MRTLLLLSLIAAAGCGSEGGGGGAASGGKPDLKTPQGVADAMVAVTGDWADVLDGIQDTESAAAARPKLAEIWTRFKEVDTAARRLGNVPDDEKKRIEAKADEAMKPFQERVERNMERLQNDPETWAIVSAAMAEASGPPPAPPSPPAR